MTETPVAVILAYYAVLFLLALPFLGLRARTLALLAVVWALVSPQSQLRAPRRRCPTRRASRSTS